MMESITVMSRESFISIFTCGTVFFSLSGTARSKGPNTIRENGYIEYNTLRTNKGLHRTDGPAVILADGRKLYYVNGKKLSKEEFFITYGVI